MKQEFQMLQEEMDSIIAINKNNPPVMKIGNYISGVSLQENINNYWQELGNKYGFKHMSVEPSAKGALFFLAEPKPIVVPKTAEEKAMDEFDTIDKIVTQLESCGYECEAGVLIQNVAFKSLKRMAKK